MGWCVVRWDQAGPTKATSPVEALPARMPRSCRENRPPRSGPGADL